METFAELGHKMSLVDTEGPDTKINFVPCLKWVRRGVAKPEPERVKLTKEELLQVIKQTKVIFYSMR